MDRKINLRGLAFIAFAMCLGINYGHAQTVKDQAWEKVYADLLSEFKQAQEITVDDVGRSPKSGGQWVFIDTRTSDEQAVSVIPGAISLVEFEKNPQQYRDTNLVAYCTIGYRSGMTAIKWREKGYNMSNLKGGVIAWANAGKSFQTLSGVPTKRVHVYDKHWNFLPENYQAIW